MFSLAIVILLPFFGYLCFVQYRRYERARRISHDYGSPSRALSSMTLKEAYAIIEELQTLEFPTAFAKARAYALLKTGGIPTISKLLMATGQSSGKNAAKRAVDTNIILMEVQTNDTQSDRHLRAIARMNYLHERYRKAGKILDDDMLHTLGSGMTEIIRFVNDHEWRKLTSLEMCALGVWHRALGEAMNIPYTALPSHNPGWGDGLHFAEELSRWVYDYEAKVAVNTPSNSAFVNRYFEARAGNMSPAIKPLMKLVLAAEVDETMQRSMGLEKPGLALCYTMHLVKTFRRLGLRYLCLPRPKSRAQTQLQDVPNPGSGFYNFRHGYVEPWYIKSSHPRQSSPEKYRAEGYSLETIGPALQEGKGMTEMDATVEFLKSYNRAGCPFSHSLKGNTFSDGGRSVHTAPK